MRILLVNYRYFISGGPEKYMFNIKSELEKHGHEVIPFSVHSNKNVETKYSKYFVEPIGGRDATYFEDCKKTPKVIWQMITRSIYSNEVEKAIKKEIKETKPDMVYIIHFINKLSPSVITGAKKMGVPIVLRLSDYFLLCPRFDFLRDKKVCEDCLRCGYKSCIKNRCVKESVFASTIRVLSMKIHNMMKIYDKVDVIITPSMFLKNKLIQNRFDGGKIHCIPTFTSKKAHNKDQILGDYALYFGRISEEKGVEIAVKAFERLPDKNLKIMGDDTTSEAIRLKKYCEDNKITNIEFIGFKSGNDLESTIENSRYTIIPSIWYDNLPNTALESFKHSKPVIASNIGSLPELIECGENGYLFEVGNVDDLIDKIKIMDTEDTIKQFGNNSKKKLESHFSMSKHYNELINVFESLIKKDN